MADLRRICGGFAADLRGPNFPKLSVGRLPDERKCVKAQHFGPGRTFQNFPKLSKIVPNSFQIAGKSAARILQERNKSRASPRKPRESTQQPGQRRTQAPKGKADDPTRQSYDVVVPTTTPHKFAAAPQQIAKLKKLGMPARFCTFFGWDIAHVQISTPHAALQRGALISPSSCLL